MSGSGLPPEGGDLSEATHPAISLPEPTADRSKLRLLVLGARTVETHALPASGAVSVGRSPEAAVVVRDPEVSRTHVILNVVPRGEGEPELSLSDAGSSNGTRVRGRRLEAGETVRIEVGDIVEVGSTSLIVQRSIADRRQRLWTHGYFELRLEEECGRVRRSAGRLAVMRLRVEAGPANSSAIDERVVNAVDIDHLVAMYAPGEYEVLLVGAGRAEADQTSEALRQALEPLGLELEIGVACYPEDGQSAEQLLDRAGSRARGEGEQSAQVDLAPDASVVVNPVMRQLYDLAARIADSDINVLILGETGAGKELLARAVHRASPRANKPLLTLNCVAFTDTLLESELFGHEKGAFTGAVHAKRGLFEVAAGGTMFLDEIGEMPLAMQAKLLRVLEDRQARRVGGIENYPIDLRFIAATNRDLAAAVGRGTFRSDLYYRLNGITLQIPPLRERPDEIEPLAMAVAARAMARLGFPGRPLIAPQVLELLRRYHWPGNVRELKNELERAIVLARGGRIEREHLPLEKLTSSYLVKDSFAGPRPPVMPLDTDLQRVVTLAKEPPKQPGRPLEAELREMERRRIVEVLEACDGNQTRAAERLGVSRKVLMTRLDEYGIPRPRKRR